MTTTRGARLRSAKGAGEPTVGAWRSPSRVVRVLWVVVAVMLVVSPVVRLWTNSVRDDSGLPQAWLAAGARLVDVDAEGNIPTWFSSGILAALAGAFLLVAVLLRTRGQRAWPFAIPAVVATAMSLDEFASIHNDLALVSDRLQIGSGVGFGWAVPGAFLAAGVGVVLLLVARSWTSALRWRMVVAGVVYLGGAVGMEFVSSPFYSRPVDGGDDSVQSVTYTLLNVMEEGLEMAGVLIALWAVLSLLRTSTGPRGLSVDLDPDNPALSLSRSSRRG